MVQVTQTFEDPFSVRKAATAQQVKLGRLTPEYISGTDAVRGLVEAADTAGAATVRTFPMCLEGLLRYLPAATAETDPVFPRPENLYSASFHSCKIVFRIEGSERAVSGSV